MKFPAIDAYRCRIFITGLIALLISSIAAILAGIYLGSASDIIAYLPALLILVPPSINMRGSISGVLASRLASSMHLGGFEISFSKKSIMGMNISASLAISIIIAFALGIIVSAISAAFGFHGISPVDLTVISIISGLISSLVVMGFTVLVILISYRYEIDLDMIGSPAVTTVADLVTIPILIVTALFVLGIDSGVRMLLIVPVAVLLIASFYTAFRTDEEITEICREMILLLIPLSVICTFAGIIYAEDLDMLVTFTVFLIILTPFTGCCGSIGGILCSRLATGMHMGEINPHLLPSKEIAWHFILSYLYVLILMPFLALLADFCAGILGMNSPGPAVMLMICVITGLIVITFVNLVAYTTASISFRKGYDPDNFGIPVITSFIDLIGATMLVTVIGLLI